MLSQSELIETALSSLPGPVFIKQVSQSESLYLYSNICMTKMMGYNDPSQVIGITDAQMKCDAAEGASIFHKNDLNVVKNGVTRNYFNLYDYSEDGLIGMFVRKTLLKEISDGKSKVVCVGMPIEDIQLYKFFVSLLPHAKYGQRKGVYEICSEFPNLNLTKRESECFYYLLRGRSAGDISQLLGISKRTVETYVDSLKLKLGLHTKADLFDFALQEGYLYIIPSSLMRKNMHLEKSL